MISRLRILAQTPAVSAPGEPSIVAFGSSPSAPATVGEAVAAGPLRCLVEEVVLGGAASEMVMDAWAWTLPPPDGYSYIAARVSMTNEGSAPVSVDNDDFGFVTSARRMWARIGLLPPEPALNGVISPGGTLQGWVAGQVEDGNDQVLLVVNCRALGGVWSERFVALTDGASLSPSDIEAIPPNTTGQQVSAPSMPGDEVVTTDWSVRMRSVAYGADVVAIFPSEDYRTTALASADPSVIPYWIAFQLEIRHAANVPQSLHWPVDALTLAHDDGSAVADVRILSSPLPDLGGTYLPGGAGAGWYLIELPVNSFGNTLRLQTSPTDQDIRYLTWSDGSASPIAEPLPAE